MHRQYPPHWVMAGAFYLSSLAGSVNVVSLLGSSRHGVAHVTGTLSQSAHQLMQGQSVWFEGLVVITFFLVGAMLSGALIPDARLRAHQRYAGALVLEAGLLLAAVGAARWGDEWVGRFSAMACGLQNGLATSYSGAVVRTTHMTGVVTDLGLMLGQALHRRPVDRVKLGLYATLLGGFFLGGLVGTGLFTSMGPWALLVPAAMALLGAVGWSVLPKGPGAEN